MLPETAGAEGDGDNLQRELQQLRDEHAMLIELLKVDRGALRAFMSMAARTLIRVRAQLHVRAREPALFRRKLGRLRAMYAQLLRRATALSLPTLQQLFNDTLLALPRPRAAASLTGDALLPALLHIDAGFLALTTIAERTGTPFVARRVRRRRGHNPGTLSPAITTTLTAPPEPQLAVALQQLAERMATEQGKRVELTAIGLEKVPEDWTGSIYDMLSQMLRNAIEHGIETPAARTELGKSARGALLVEFHPRGGAQAELIFQDDGQGLNAGRIVETALARGLIGDDASLAHDPRQASTLIFHGNISTAADGANRGAGMRIVRDHVKRLSGQIQVATKRGQFTRFRIRLPMARASDASAAQA